ncbi:uncharacterized protein SCHCODRAFT_02488547 [Schizophyllum commune H4-8]|nr:uncharacterized protein SCHCODRAFT_02488547 [Schizophyllum commune H4-8]KAI5897434.1 hypothetical protein SCHCODRAFT_02488547 [Schizophyllum commune H4-8]
MAANIPTAGSLKLGVAMKTLVVFSTFYFGINDCDTVLAEDVEAPIDKVLAAVRKLHEEYGAKHFVLMDVPPLERAPEGMQLKPSFSAFPELDVLPPALKRTPENKTQVIAAMAAWNRILPVKVAEFQRAAPGVTLSIFSVRDVFTAVLDDPKKYGFTKNDLTEVGGGIWADEVHATPAVQEIVAKWLIEGKA